MESQETRYYTPSTVDEACELLHEKRDAIVVAGGQSLGLLTKEGIVSPEVLVDISRIDKLKGWEPSKSQIRFGALCTHRELETSDEVAESVPVLSKAAGTIADVQIRNAGTLGGVVAYADPTADYPPVLLAADATITARSVDGESEYSARDFFTGYYESVLEPKELVTFVSVPLVGEDSGMGFEKLARRNNDRALVNVAARLRMSNGTCENADVAVGSVGMRTVLAPDSSEHLLGTEVRDEDIATTAASVREEVEILPDPSVPEEYRAAMVERLTVEALNEARSEVEGT